MCHVLDIFSTDVDEIYESTNVGDVSGCWPGADFLDETRVGATTVSINDVSQELDLRGEEVAFVQIQDHPCVFKGLQNQFNMLLVFLLCL